MRDSDVPQAMWALGNIAADSARCRDLVLSYGVVTSLITQCNEAAVVAAALLASGDSTTTDDKCLGSCPTSLQLLRNAIWLISNLCRSMPPPRFALISEVIPLLARLLVVCQDEEVLTDCCWALSHVSETADRITYVLGSGALPDLVRLLGHESPTLQESALRAVANVVAGSADETASALSAGVLVRLGPLLSSTKRSLRRDTCWMISNLVVGPPAQVEVVCATGVIKQLLTLAESEEFDIRKEICFCICNVCVYGAHLHVFQVCDCGALKLMVEMLKLSDSSLIVAVLEASHKVLTLDMNMNQGSPYSRYAQMLEEVGFCEILEYLEMHEILDISERATKLMNSFAS